ncbi:MAG: DUF1439 domain-containing protein [Ghiorsea sp.]|nr:DUF1439 domain-containing protein [Ghiorsea sp.]
MVKKYRRLGISQISIMNKFVYTIFFAGLLLSGCSSDLTFQISESELQAKVNAKLPYQKTYFRIFKTTIEKVAIDLVDAQVKMSFDIKLETKGLSLFKKTPSGSIDVLATPVYHSQTGEVFLTNLKLLSMDIEGINHGEKLEATVENIIADYLSIRPVYKLKPSDLKKDTGKRIFAIYFGKG